ncbi:hypothetical protein JN01_0364 [Entomoplasma freundtii]|uniref:Uncharacterized protein n=1 Tax=Entomoplasma freundtii TaxID=74700 RepID=A0A2K8NR10_9MOLU|nr:hypothetical protein [Entomoplasma freundtii]ATZ16224.1 hypothetical protein EFREU_v1c01970 [Entomoplasma freundtii]TDY56875.1 hypothetical protein JN01_0364 [Entomoplasma freundtii]
MWKIYLVTPLLSKQFNPQTLIISIVCTIVFIALMATMALLTTGNRHRKIYQESQEIIAKISAIDPLEPIVINQPTALVSEEDTNLNFPDSSQKSISIPIRVFAKTLDQFVLPKTELPQTKINHSLALLEGFVDAKKSREPVAFVDTKMEIFPDFVSFTREADTFVTTFDSLFYCRMWIDIQTKSLIFSFVTYDDQISPKFQFFNYEDLKKFHDFVWKQKTQNITPVMKKQ